MNWITTNIRLPEDLYMELKMEAAQSRKSVSGLIRERLKRTKQKGRTQKKVWKDIEVFARKISGKYPDLNLSKKLIEMRYEQ